MKDPRHAYPPLGVVVLGIVVVALSLRGPIVAVTPVLQQVSGDLGLSAGAAGLVGTLPVLAFAVASPLAALTVRRAGPEAAILLTMLGILVSQLVRAIPSTATLFAGTIALGLAITLGNIVVPVVIRRDVPLDRVGSVTGLYTAVLNIGSLLTALATAPLAEVLGWPLALAAWSLLAAAGLSFWGVRVRRQRTGSSGHPGAAEGPSGQAPAEATPPPRSATRNPATWLLSAAFASQSFSYYAYTTWLPTYLVDTTGSAVTSAGAMASTFQAWGIVGGFLVPALFRLVGLRWTAGIVGSLWLALSTGLILAPAAIAWWLTLGGIAQAGGFIVVFSALALASSDAREMGGMSAVVQTLGYVVAASAGPVVGALREATGGWGVPLWVLVGATASFTTFSLVAAFHVHGPSHRPRSR
ncbi:MFS transporter [Intrasporangium calvum]|uniref:MFS transporter n=1 Tax=Intrasporangium calvum TaxID=53358 RepID=A0ABT5GFD7_9MICO|nr:MFS transporter [Intrasporangium calvum]MDC5696919.1 MFS transporter [Intrasporangium calvum]